ncbi:MAG: hypothetical protein K0U52_01145 [Gammaproteobacteria bacterium]|nr:hypothetical protein [Gammaproteobacteria bacterium]
MSELECEQMSTAIIEMKGLNMLLDKIGDLILYFPNPIELVLKNLESTDNCFSKIDGLFGDADTRQ